MLLREVLQFSIEAAVSEKTENIVDSTTGLFLGAMRLATGANETEEGGLKFDFISSTPDSPIAYSIPLAIRNVASAQSTFV